MPMGVAPENDVFVPLSPRFWSIRIDKSEVLVCEHRIPAQQCFGSHRMHAAVDPQPKSDGLGVAQMTKVVASSAPAIK